MKVKKFCVAAGRMFGVAAVTLIVISMFAASAAAQSHYKVLHRFNNTREQLDGTSPYGGVILDADGNLYGTTAWGWGDPCYWHGCGIGFKLTQGSDGRWAETVILKDFLWTDPGSWPMAGFVFDANGNLYGTTAGDYQCCGRVFAGTPNLDGSWTWTELHSFTGGTDGARPYAGLILDADGNLYGTTTGGGTYGYGVVFRLTKNSDGSWTESVLHHFTGGRDGANPYSRLILDGSGNLYGTTVNGGCAGYGVVFKLTPNTGGTWKEKVLHAFLGHPGKYPYSGLIFDTANNLYGTTYNGGPADGGMVYKLAPNTNGTWTYSVLHVFTGTPGLHPVAGVVMDKAGNLYGNTVNGGSADAGTVYELTPNANGSWTYRVLHVFTGTPARNPYGDLLLDAAGNLYGTTAGGNMDCGNWADCGTVFEITP